jgi:hypothetical protein
VALADDLDGLAFLHADLRKSLPTHARDAASGVIWTCICYLKAYTLPIICHCSVPILHVVDHTVAGAGKRLVSTEVPRATRPKPYGAVSAMKLQGNAIWLNLLQGAAPAHPAKADSQESECVGVPAGPKITDQQLYVVDRLVPRKRPVKRLET